MTLEDFLRHIGHFGGPMFVMVILPLAGVVASAVCPCTIPVGIGIAGMAGTSESEERRSGFLVAAAFFAGIVVNLAVLGAVSGRMGGVLSESFGRNWALTMAVISLGAGLVAFRGPRVAVAKLSTLRKPGVIGSFIYGFIFSLGTSAAPLLLVLTVAAAQENSGHGALLAVAFGVGRGLPFLLVGLFAGAFTRFIHLQRWRKLLQIVSGGALLFVSAYYGWVFISLI